MLASFAGLSITIFEIPAELSFFNKYFLRLSSIVFISISNASLSDELGLVKPLFIFLVDKSLKLCATNF